MQTEEWLAVSPQQLGRMSEYVARMEFAKRGYSIYVPEIDDRGIDLLVHRGDTGYKRVQVKSVRGYQYVFMRKRYFDPQPDLDLCLVIYLQGKTEMFLVPSTRWLTPCSVFCDRDYEAGKSAPEYGINVSRKNFAALNAFRFAELPVMPAQAPQGASLSVADHIEAGG